MPAVSRPCRAALVPIEIATAGTYRVALSEGAWVDMVRDGTSLPSVAHGHGPRCSGIHKIVDFKLAPGRYALQLSAMQTPQVRVLIARGRSEEHTSELQSLMRISYAVFCLKKKNNTQTTPT